MYCLLNIVTYLGGRKYVSIPNASLGNWVKILGVLVGRLHMDFVSLVRSFSILQKFGIEKGTAYNTYSMPR